MVFEKQYTLSTARMDAFKALVEAMMTPSTPTFVIGGLIVLLLPILVHLYLSRSATYTILPSVLVVGPSNAGKTALTTLLERRTGTPSDTHTSQTSATVELAVDEARTEPYTTDLDATGAVATKFLLIDSPGHGKLRGAHALERLTPDAAKNAKLKAVVFVVDAATLSEPDVLADTAAYLYEVLLRLQKRMGVGKTSKAPDAIPVLVAANKMDLFTALPAKLVKSNLEKELGRIRRTRRKGLLDSGVGADELDVDAGDEADDWLGEYGSEEFRFEQMREFDIEVEVEGGSVLGEKANVDKWWSWIGDKL